MLYVYLYVMHMEKYLFSIYMHIFIKFVPIGNFHVDVPLYKDFEQQD